MDKKEMSALHYLHCVTLRCIAVRVRVREEELSRALPRGAEPSGEETREAATQKNQLSLARYD